MIPGSRSTSLLLAAAAATAHAQSCSVNDLTVDYPAPEAADGWSYRLVARDLTKPRSILFDSDGHLIVLDAGEGIYRFGIDQDEGGTCLSLGDKETLLENEDLNHGLALSEDGETIYASTENEVYSWPYDASRSSINNDDRTTLITNMSNTDHTTRTLLLSKSEPVTLFVSRGSQSNLDDEAADIDSGHSQIRGFNLTDLGGDDPVEYTDGRVWGWGLRNAVGVAEDPTHGGLWSVENSVDELRRNGEDIHRDNPGEELNFHGFVNGTDARFGNNNYGYPECYAIWGTENFPDRGDLVVGDQFPDEDNSDETDETCNEDYLSPRLTFQAHMAPLDILFAQDGRELFVSFHGSWNREDPVGYKISSVAFNADGMPEANSDSRNGTKDVLTTPDLGNCPDECFRPVGMAWDADGRMWFTSDSTGEIFVMERTSGGGDNGDGSDGGDDDGDEEDAAVSLTQPRLVVAFGAIVVGLLLV
ncbi:L-sorbosone dehydrogenase-like protein [Emericellopsis cladophorae]|uniref:L-sorbosone dehydrogenase-like protein n=1 Tax=Emericellopsis cladophorae TaxID=2686198 RepID=A0A9P9XWE9_9HYPO|nr:L-sorbosone dehydrogenase-like protein [Emericellopsis cladophorae]KAI6778990.1 L-sorbosone dehydrogenase-like protein [Emericellopsis cladophorae]